jgi:hypothetical protein
MKGHGTVRHHIMKSSPASAGLRRGLLGLAGLLMAFAAFVNATAVVGVACFVGERPAPQP